MNSEAVFQAAQSQVRYAAGAVIDLRKLNCSYRPERSFLNDRFGGRIQLVNATHSLNISAGVLKPSVLRGLSFNCLAIALS
jgi:hypothetical protein